MGTLDGKIAIITGASSGIGRATALAFAVQGARLVINARGQKPLDALADEIIAGGGQVVALAGDVQSEDLNRQLVDLATARFGGLDIAFNNAGALGELGPVGAMDLSTWAAVIATNLTGAFLGAKHQIPAMAARGGGSIVFTSSFVGHTAGIPGMGAYGAAKAGLVGLAKVLAAECAAQGIRVNAILPGGVDTPMAEAFANTEEARSFVAGLHALKRTGTPDEIARAVLYLASDAGSFTTGTAMLVDGGVSINRM